METKVEYVPNQRLERMAAAKTMKTYRHSMSVDEFYCLYGDKAFRMALHMLINAHSKNVELREDMLQEAWTVISQLPWGYEKDVYLRVGEKAADSCRKREHRYWLLFKENCEAKQAKERRRKRIFRIRKKAINILQTCPK